MKKINIDIPDVLFRDYETMGTYLKNLRKKNELTMQRLAKSSGISQPFLSLIENDKNFPSDETLNKLVEGIAFCKELDNKDLEKLREEVFEAKGFFINRKEEITNLIYGISKGQFFGDRTDSFLNALDSLVNRETIDLTPIIERFESDNKDKANSFSVTLDGKELSFEELKALYLLLYGIKNNRN